MERPSAESVRARSELLTERYPVLDGDAALVILIEDASVMVSSLTCRDIGVGEGEEVPVGQVPLAVRAVTLKAEQLAVLSGTKARKGAASAGRVRSFSAGSYSESYFGPDEAAKAGRLDADPVLHEALWALATEACREAWFRLWAALRGDAPQVPAEAISEVDWLPSARRSNVLGEEGGF